MESHSGLVYRGSSEALRSSAETGRVDAWHFFLGLERAALLAQIGGDSYCQPDQVVSKRRQVVQEWKGFE